MTLKTNIRTPDEKPVANRRSEIRFPCVGIGLLYSPILRQCAENVGRDFLTATLHDCSLSGLSFDVEQALQPGDKLYVLISSHEQSTERLTAEVCWCRPICDKSFRAGIRILTEHGLVTDTCMKESIPILHGPPVPSEVNFLCPSCQQKATFTYMDTQGGDWEQGIMPLYNCSNCDTTRTILTILEYNRSQQINKKP